MLRSFSRKYSGSAFGARGPLLSDLAVKERDLPPSSGRILSPGHPSPARLALFVTPSQLLQYGNINPLSIGYAFRPCLRNRLTLPRLTLDRNPWSSGGRAFNPSYRYSRQHSHFRTLQETFRFPFSAYGTLLPPAQAQVRGFGSMFEPRYIFRAGRLDQ